MSAEKYSDDQLVARYLELRTFLELEAERQALFVKPHIEAMATISNELHARLLARNPNWQPGMKASGSAGGGTFFLKTSTSIKVAERDDFFQFIVEAGLDTEDVAYAIILIKQRIQQFLTAHVAKEGIEEYQKEHNDALPPGVTIDRFAQLQVRKT